MNRHGWKDLFNSWWFDSSFSKETMIQCNWNILLRSNLAQNHFTKTKREMKSKIPKKFLEMIAQRRDKTTPGSFLAGVLTHGIFYDSRRILKGPWYSYSNYLNRFLFFSLSVCLSEVIFTWHFRVHGQLNFPRKKTTVRVNLRIFRLSLQLKLSLIIELT